MTKFLIIDGNSLGCRSAFAAEKLSKKLITKEGIPTGTIVLFINLLNKIMMKIQPTHICCCWDTNSNTFRKKLYPEYKANRHKKEIESDINIEIMYKQFKFIRKILEKLGIRNINVETFEGDDLCGTCANISLADENYIISGDQDSFSLVNDHTFIIYPKIGFTSYDIVTFKYIQDKFNIDPKNYLGLKTLRGDVSDNIMGFKGCGIKTATKMLNEFGSSDKIAKLKIDDLINYNKTIKNNFEDWQHRYKLIKLLMTIRKDVPIPYEFDNFEIDLLRWNDIKPLLEGLEMYNLINRIGWNAVYRLQY